MRLWRKVLPVLVSALLIVWVVQRVSLEELKQKSALLEWRPLVVLTAGLVAGCFLWDSFCLRWLFSGPQLPLRFQTALQARGTSYLASVLNYEVGQGVLAWRLSQAQGLPLVSAVGRCVWLTVHDLTVLLALGLIGSLFGSGPPFRAIRIFCGSGLIILMVLAMVLSALPTAWRNRLNASRWGSWLGWWNWARSARLCLLRGGYFAIILIYVASALPLCGINLEYSLVCSVIPLVLLADGLPISVSGLGTRETALLVLLNPDLDLRSSVVAFSLFWSSGLIIGRAVIGLGYYWLPRCRPGRSAESNDEGVGVR